MALRVSLVQSSADEQGLNVQIGVRTGDDPDVDVSAVPPAVVTKLLAWLPTPP